MELLQRIAEVREGLNRLALPPPPAALGLLRRRVLRDHRLGRGRDRRRNRRWRGRCGVRGHCRRKGLVLDRHVAARHLLDRLAVQRRGGLAVDRCSRRLLLAVPAVAALGTLALAILAPTAAASAAAATAATAIALVALLPSLTLAGLGGRAFAFFLTCERLAFGLHRSFGGRRLVVSVRGGGVGTVLAP